ncbi:flagellar export chaperone FlgN [Tropicibacter sp. R16_0]|uniref:flagellar export chaperone FlgN n=1 Tax=Tropicibacter sp. R16_0 TaxID=2821102 RepID=UPI001ADC9971|nr:flagellar export chaperone FlgN [Tropicibacter sp. R16_0]MBO9450559.1 flagellar export chaperone FlgN [Tropicibacter sp. R16_0]
MKSETPTELIAALDELLDLERAALVDGELERLGVLLPQKEKLIERINTLDSVEREALAGVQSKVSRNQSLLNSAMEGIQAVANRMAELRRVRRGLETYDESGRKMQHNTQVSKKLEKRA